MTTYKVLAKVDGQSRWHELEGEYEAAHDEAAIKAALLSKNGRAEAGIAEAYVAIPVRSFKPRKVEAKQAYSFS